MKDEQAGWRLGAHTYFSGKESKQKRIICVPNVYYHSLLPSSFEEVLPYFYILCLTGWAFQWKIANNFEIIPMQCINIAFWIFMT